MIHDDDGDVFLLETTHIRLEIPGTLHDKKEKPARCTLFQSTRIRHPVDAFMYAERSQGLLLCRKHLMMSFLLLFLVLIILLIYLLFRLFPPSLIKPVFGDLARPRDIQELDIPDNIKV